MEPSVRASEWSVRAQPHLFRWRGKRAGYFTSYVRVCYLDDHGAEQWVAFASKFGLNRDELAAFVGAFEYARHDGSASP